MFGFLRRIFTPGPHHFADGSANMAVSVKMRVDNFRRLDRLARFTNQPGDSILDLAIREWLAAHEDAILYGREVVQDARRRG